MKLTPLFIFCLFFDISMSQETVGLIYRDIEEQNNDGFILFSPISTNDVYLINKCGEVVKNWEFSSVNEASSISSSYLLEDGKILYSNAHIGEIRDWDNNFLWKIDYFQKFNFKIHHDIEPLPNGNFLVLVRDVYSKTELLARGLDSSYLYEDLTLERIVEIKPIGNDDAEIVWEWRLIDHLIQDIDSSLDNYGVISENPQLLNLNYENGNGFNPIHINAIDFNEELNQIILSARHLNEVFIIDHSTTTEQAATSSGGFFGKGGSFLWRWGNPEVYNQGASLDRMLGKQHDIKWIDKGVHKGKLSVFNNEGFGFNDTESSIHIIEPNHNNGVYILKNQRFEPEDFEWSWAGNVLDSDLLSSIMGGVQVLENGNFLIMESTKGRIIELNSHGKVIWVYAIPLQGKTLFSQFDIPTRNFSFRAKFYDREYFNNLIFDNLGILENVNSISENCINSNLLSISYNAFSINIFPNPTTDIININSNLKIFKIEIYDLMGKLLLSVVDSNSVNLKSLKNGLYIANIITDEYSKSFKILKI